MLVVIQPVNPRLLAIAKELGISESSIVARGLSVYEETDFLELVEVGEDGREHFLCPAAAVAWRNLMASALKQGISLFIESAFRSVERQAEIVRGMLDDGLGIAEVLGICAPPGFSEHHTGRAIDVCTPGASLLQVEFDQTPAFAWLTEEAGTFRFYLSYPSGNPQGYQYEPWHWCFRDT